LCVYEVVYFGKLVEDLLFLAQITEPKYSAGTEVINLVDRVQEQFAVLKERYPRLQFSVDSIEVPRPEVIGSLKLIDRLIRNALENAASFAKSKVAVKVSFEGTQAVLSVIDDGPGFTEKSLKEFGHKKTSRMLSNDSQAGQGRRISVGIGSVIMKEILQVHRGELRAENVVDHNKVSGGKVSFLFQKSNLMS
jgi:K+-sensing histidine kinase KdpD